MADKEKKTPESSEMSLAEVQAAIAEMLQQAREEAQKQADAIIAEAKALAENEKNAKSAAEAKALAEDKARGEELVEIKLFKDNSKYKEPVFVGVNGETWAIERGVRVPVPRKVAEVLDNSDKQDYETSVLIENKQKEYEKVAQAFA